MTQTNGELEKISRVIIRPTKELSLRMHVRLLRETDGRKENFHKVVTYGSKNYLSLDIQGYLTLELKRDDWSPDKWLRITQANIFHVIKGFKAMLNSIYTGDIFAVTKGKKTIMYKGKVNEHTQNLNNLGTNNWLRISPAIIYDENDISYEGVILYINKTENYVPLSIDEFESLLYALEKVDIFLYSQEILNYFMLSLKDQKLEIQPTFKKVFNKSDHPIFNKEAEEVKSTIFKEESPKEFFGI